MTYVGIYEVWPGPKWVTVKAVSKEEALKKLEEMGIVPLSVIKNTDSPDIIKWWDTKVTKGDDK